MRVALGVVAGALFCFVAACQDTVSTGPGQGNDVGPSCDSCKKGNSGGGGSRTAGGSSSSSSGGSSTTVASGGSTSGASAGTTSSRGSSSVASSSVGGSTSGGSSSVAATSSAGGSSSGVASSSVSGSSGGGGSSSGCAPLQAAGGPCTSAIDCQAGLACTGEECQQANQCVPGVCFDGGPQPTAACAGNGSACTAAKPCCDGTCNSGFCAPLGFCGVTNAPCTTSANCCDGFACSSGTCQPTCGSELSSCQLDTDCCQDLGFVCALIVQLSASFCVPGAEDQICAGGSCASGQTPVNCGGHCSEYECQLGAACAPLPDGGDPCEAAGMICDTSNQVCRHPQLFEGCAPGGPSCEPFPQTNLATTCLNLTSIGDGDLCLQACSETSDCADPLTSCYSATQTIVGGGFCNADQCAPNFAKCAAQGAADGLCEPQGPQYSFCHQESLDGGGAVGQYCDFYDNRQRGDFCAFPNICMSGVCAVSCNAGTSGVPACAAGTRCYGVQGLFGDPADLGGCSVACDFTSPDGGGCKQVVGGPPQKCLPELLLTGNDSPDGFCSAEVASAPGLGQACNTDPGGLDSCAAGLLCLQPTVAQNTRCFQLCNLVSSIAGTGGCAANQTCTALNFGGGTQPTNTGYCQ